MVSVTFSTCFYEIKSKFDKNTYKHWMNNFLLYTTANVVVYTDSKSIQYLPSNMASNIKVVIKELSEFFNYKYKEDWIRNNEQNYLLNYISWELQMLWAEKVNFVYETSVANYFNTEWFGWCDIGYFRDAPIEKNWGTSIDNTKFSDDYIYYGCVCDKSYVDSLNNLVQTSDENGLPLNPIPNDQISVAGGFFICNKKHVQYWREYYDSMLIKYFKSGRLVKDDQIIIINCALLNQNVFKLIFENNRWFMFRGLLN